jgi:predicted alpha/beta hydrolase
MKPTPTPTPAAAPETMVLHTEGLPRGVYQDWKHWCRFPNYFCDDPAMAYAQGQFDSVTTPIVAANATDDLWATLASRDAFMAGYRNANWQPVTIDTAHGHGPIGHMGYLHSCAQPLWESALQWFGEHTCTPPLSAH